MSSFRNVSNLEPCPICGKPDWCSIQYVERGEKIHYCRRILNGSNIISSLTGETYIFIKQAKDGSCLYKEENAYMAAKEEWLSARHGSYRKPGVKRKTVNPSSGPPVRTDYEVIPLDNRQLDKIYRSFLNRLHLQKNHIRYFSNQKWTKELIIQSGVKSMPPNGKDHYYGSTRSAITSALINEFGALEGVPGFYEGADGTWTFAGAGGILIPLYDYEKNMYRLRLRLDHPDVDANGKEKNKYNNFSSYHEIMTSDKKIKNAYSRGCRAGSHIGIYENPSRDDYTICYITEGEKKSIYANYILHNPVISVPGVNSFKKVLENFADGYNTLDYLASKGCRMIIIAYDSDKYVNEAVIMYEKKLIELLAEHSFQIALAYWNPGLGKGLDDILSIDARPNYELVKV